MLKSVAIVPIDDLATFLIAFLPMVVIPFTYSIIEGLAIENLAR